MAKKLIPYAGMERARVISSPEPKTVDDLIMERLIELRKELNDLEKDKTRLEKLLRRVRTARSFNRRKRWYRWSFKKK